MIPFRAVLHVIYIKYTLVIVKSGFKTLIQYTLNLNILLFQNKYFDSGEYNMTKAKIRGSKLPPAAQENMILQEPPGDAIPTPEAIATIRKPSLQQSKLAELSWRNIKWIFLYNLNSAFHLPSIVKLYLSFVIITWKIIHEWKMGAFFNVLQNFQHIGYIKTKLAVYKNMIWYILDNYHIVLNWLSFFILSVMWSLSGQYLCNTSSLNLICISDISDF